MKNKKIKTLDIIFENCEVYILTPDMIDTFYISNVSENIGINLFQFENGEVHSSLSCQDVLLSINKNGMQLKDDIDNMTLEDRLKCKDITHFDIIYEDGSNSYIEVPWENKDGNEFVNKLQNTFYTEYIRNNDESLVVIINKKPLTIGELEEKYGIC
mgnify:CR=1 FL=1|jgi:hypothetical protein